METTNFALHYLDSEPKTKQQLAQVYVKTSGRQQQAGMKTDILITSPCSNFVELDAEIRRLHAELEEIRAQARRKFYRAQAACA